MRAKLLVVFGILLCVAASDVRAQRQFSVFASIVDAFGASVDALEPSDLRVMENGVEAKVVSVEPMKWPTKVQLLLDNGIGLGATNVTQLKNGVVGLLDALPPGVEVTIVSTAPQPRFLARATADRAAMQKGLALLSPDGGTGRFVEGLSDATQRIERDKGDYFPVIVMVGTTSGDRNVLDSDVERLMKRLAQRPTMVHVVLLSGQAQASVGNQIEVGLAVTKYTGGQFDSINSPTRLATLLPEIGELVAVTHENQGQQFRITIERPADASGDLGTVSMGGRPGLTVKALSLDRRIP